MPADDNQERPGFSELLAELTDSDVVIEVAATGTSRQTLRIRPGQTPLNTPSRPRTGRLPARCRCSSRRSRCSKRSQSAAFRCGCGCGIRATARWRNSSDASLLEFLARGTLAIIAWMDGSPTPSSPTFSRPSVCSPGDVDYDDRSPGLARVRGFGGRRLRLAEGKGRADWLSVRIATNNGSASSISAKPIEEPRTLLLSRKLINHWPT